MQPNTLLFIGLIGLVGLYLLGQWAFRLPIVIYRTQRFNATPTLQPFDLEATPPPGKAGQYFRAMDRQFVACGFERLNCVALPDALHNVRALLVLYINRRTKDLAMASMMYGIDTNTGEVNQCTYYVEIFSRFQDDNLKVIQTSNVQMLGSFPPAPGERTYRFPHVDQIERLFQLHCKLIERDRPVGKKMIRLETEFRGDCLAYIESVFIESYEKQIVSGYLTRDRESESYRPTIKGALLMSWAQQSPVKEYLWNRVKEKALRLERELL